MNNYLSNLSMGIKKTQRKRWIGLWAGALFVSVFLLMYFLVVGATPALAGTNSSGGLFIAQVTGTVTTTVTVTPTNTPTPLSPGIVLEKSVNPPAAGIGGVFTFTIKISNQGSGPASKVTFLDVFPPVLTIVSVTSNENEDVLIVPLEQINASNVERRIEISMVPIAAGAGRRVTIVARVNALAVASGNYANTATMYFNDTLFKASNTVGYQILTSVVLPPTGGKEINTSRAWGYLPLLIVGLLLGGLGGVAMFFARRVKSQQPQLAGRFVVVSLALIAASLVVSLAACSADPPVSVSKPAVEQARQ